jgi:hypothetical protein
MLRSGGAFGVYREVADNGGPLADVPALDQTVFHVWIRFRKSLGCFGRVAFEEQDGTIGRVGERSAEDEFAAFRGFPSELEMDVAEFCAAGDVVVGDLVEEKVMHGGSCRFGFYSSEFRRKL